MSVDCVGACQGVLGVSCGSLIGQGLGKVVVSGVWLGVMGAWGLWILG